MVLVVISDSCSVFVGAHHGGKRWERNCVRPSFGPAISALTVAGAVSRIRMRLSCEKKGTVLEPEILSFVEVLLLSQATAEALDRAVLPAVGETAILLTSPLHPC